MNNIHNKNKAKIIGIFFIIAAISAIIGLVLYYPILDDQNDLIEGAKNSNQIILGAIFELILVSTVVGTGITFFPYLKQENETMALGYFCFRMLEAIFIMIGIISVLSLLSMSQEYSIYMTNIETYQIIAKVLKNIHKWSFILGPNFMLGINTFLYSYLLYRSKMITVKISMLGIISAAMIFLASLLEIFGLIQQVSTIGFLLAFPIFIYEMTLAVWLITKGITSKEKEILNDV